MAAKAAPDGKPLTVPVAVVTVLLSLACVWFRFPAGAVLLLGITIAAMMMSPPRLTGKPGPDGVATPVGGGEEAMLAQYTTWSTLRRRLLSPSGWLPMPTTESLTALGVAFIVFALPTDLRQEHVPQALFELFDDPGLLHPMYTPLVSAVGVYVVLHAALQASRFKVAGETKPAVGVSEIVGAVKSMGVGVLIVLAFAVMIAAGGGVFVWVFLTASDGHVRDWLLYPMTVGAGVGALLLAGITHASFGPSVMRGWQQRQEARGLWNPRWASQPRMLESPQLVHHERFGEDGNWHADTFQLPGSIGGAKKALALYEQIEHTFSGYQAVFVSAPVTGDDGKPVEGTRDPNTLLAYTWAAGAQRSLAEPDSHVMQVQMMAQHAIAGAAIRAKLKDLPPLVTHVEQLHDKDSPTALWQVSIALPEDTGAGELAAMLVKLREAGLDGLLVDGDARVQIMQDKNDFVVGVFSDETQLANEEIGERLTFIGVQDYWRGRFSQVGKLKVYPELLRHDTFGSEGSFWVDEFSVPPGVGLTHEFERLLTSSMPPDANDRRTVFMSAPKRDANNEAIPGTRDETKIAAYTWPDSERPDIADPGVDLALMRVWSQAQMKYAYDEASVQARVALVESFEPLHDPDAEGTTAAWLMQLTQPDVGIELSDMLGYAMDLGGLSSMITGDQPDLGLITDGPHLFFGALGASTTFADPSLPKHLERLTAGREWVRAWRDGGAKRPALPQWDSQEKARLGSGVTMHKMAFGAPFGDPLSTYLDLKPDALKTAMNPMVRQLAIVPHAAAGTAGTSERNDSVFSVVWTHDPLSIAPHLLQPDAEPSSRAGSGPRFRQGMRPRPGHRRRNRAQQMVLEISVFTAFHRVKLEQPMLVQATPLTTSVSHQHLWDIEIRLFGQVTLQTLRASKVFQALKNAFSAPYLRIAPTTDGNVRILVGGDPANELDFVSDSAFTATIQLDWEQSFQSSGVLHEGEAPQLVDASVMPANKRVQQLVFQLPQGMHPAKLTAAKDKLSGSAGMAFMHISPGPQPGHMTVLCSVDDPLRFPMLFDWDAVMGSSLIPFGASVTGEPIEYDRGEDPHILVLGQSGSGKAQPLDARIPVPVSAKFPDGWAQNGALEVGDCVFTPAGTATTITSFSMTREEPVFEVSTDDGQRTAVSGHHMWRVKTQGAATGMAFTHRRVNAERAAGLLEVAARVGAEIGGTASQITALANLDPGELERSGVLHDALVRHGLEDTGAKTAVYEADRVLAHALAVVQDSGTYTFAGKELSREDILDLSLEGAWLSARSLADALTLGRASDREVELAQLMLDGLRVPSRLGPERAPIELYPVDEVLRLLAERYQGADEGEIVVTTEALADLVAQGHDVAILSPAPIPGGAGFRAADFAAPKAPLPTFVLRGSVRSRMELVQLWMSQAADDDGWSTLRAAKPGVAASMVELARSVGVKARQHGVSVSLSQTPALQVVSVTKGAPMAQRCLRTADSSHLYLTGGFVPTHNSAAMQSLLTVALIRGFDAIIIDTQKSGGDFRYAEDWILGFADDEISAGAVMDQVRAEMKRRKNLTRDHKVNRTSQLPEQVRPRPLAILIDEFTSMMTSLGTKPKMPEDGADQEAMAEYSAAVAEFEGKMKVAEVAGRIVREARSMDIMLILGGQNLPADLIKSMPNNAGTGLKSNMARLVMGKTSYGERMSGFKNPDAVPDLGEQVPIGRGVFEGKGAPKIVQIWYDSENVQSPSEADKEHQAAMAAKIGHAKPALTAAEQWDVVQMTQQATQSAEQFGQVIVNEAEIPAAGMPDVDEIEEVELGDFSFDDDDVSEASPVVENEPGEVVDFSDEAFAEDEAAEEVPEELDEFTFEDDASTPEALEREVPADDDAVDWESLLSDDDADSTDDVNDDPQQDSGSDSEAREDHPAAPDDQDESQEVLATDTEGDLFAETKAPAQSDDLFGEPKKVPAIDDDLFGEFA